MNHDHNNSLFQLAQTDLDLLAFCYLSDELSEAEQRNFEHRLVSEQPAREALARAVELTAALHACESHVSSATRELPLSSAPLSSRSRSFEHWMQATAWLAIASAACLAVVVGSRAARFGADNSTAFPSETALVWSQVRAAWPESPVAEALGSTATDATLLDDPEEFDAAADEQVESELNSELPGWLLTAVAGGSEENDAPTVNPDHNSDPEDREDL